MGGLTLALGATAETVTVEGAAPIVETNSAQGSTTFTSTSAGQLPLNGGFDQLTLLVPGVVSAGMSLGQGIVTGSLAGTVVDPQKAVVVGAKVDARNIATNVDFKVHD